jgi:hypothetical protein
MTASILIVPEPQFADADGNPYAGGTIVTFVPGTTTGKTTWRDPQQSVVNTNPITLDAAGRCRMWGDGDYRLILYDAAGNMIWDALTTSIVSAAMAPVVSAPTIAEAVRLLGINDLIDAEAQARAAADSAETAARIAADNAEAAARAAADADLQAKLDAEIARATAAEAALVTVQKLDHGVGITDSDSHVRITFATTFSGAPAVTVAQARGSWDVVSDAVMVDGTGFDVWFAFPLSGGITHAGVRQFYWIAVGV